MMPPGQSGGQQQAPYGVPAGLQQAEDDLLIDGRLDISPRQKRLKLPLDFRIPLTRQRPPLFRGDDENAS